MISKVSKTLALVCAAWCIVSCASPDEDEAQNADELYTKAKTLLNNENYAAAILIYEELEIKHPFHRNARNAVLDLAYGYYQNGSPLESEEKADFFIRQYPDDPRIDYAHYLKAVANYNYADGIVYKVINFDRTDKDPTPLVKAFNTFRGLIADFPDSQYVDSAQRHLVVIRNTLAVYEIKVADYYFQREAYVAAANRIRYMLEHYDGAQHAPAGLLLLYEAYRRLGKQTLAADTRRVLELNFPEYAERRIDGDGQLKGDSDEGWLNLREIGDTLLESLHLKPRY